MQLITLSKEDIRRMLNLEIERNNFDEIENLSNMIVELIKSNREHYVMIVD